MKRLTLLFVLLGLLIATAVMAAVPNQMNVQGRLLNAGSPMIGSHPAIFSIFDAATGGTTLWTESSSLEVQGGIFAATLGTNTPIPTIVFDASPRWLEVSVDGNILTPRLELTTSAYAFRSQHADTASYALNTPPTGDNLWSTDGTNVWRETGKVGIGINAPVTNLDVTGTAHITSEVGIGADAIGGVPLRVGGFVRVDGGPAGSVRMMSNGTNGILETLDNSPLALQPSGGYVGIGTNIPAHTLEAHSTTEGQVAYFHSTSTSGTNYGVDAGAQGIGATTNIGGYFYASGATNNYAIIVPPGYGNTGLGTNVPDKKLTVVAPVGTNDIARFRTDNGNCDVVITAAEDRVASIRTLAGQGLAIGTNNGNGPIRITSAGDVGIGTNAPEFKLHVIGSFTATGTKCREVDSPEYGKLYFNAVESGEAIFTTSGRGQLENGACHIELNPKWLAGVTIDDRHPMDVTTITFYGPHGEAYAQPGLTGFDIVDPSGSNSSFFWTVQARQKGYADRYLDNPSSVAKR